MSDWLPLFLATHSITSHSPLLLGWEHLNSVPSAHFSCPHGERLGSSAQISSVFYLRVSEWFQPLPGSPTLPLTFFPRIFYSLYLGYFVSCLFMWGPTGSQSLLLAMCSEITPRGLRTLPQCPGVNWNACLHPNVPISPGLLITAFIL